MTEQSLKDKTAKGLFWGGLSNGMQQLLNLIFGIALARILDAEDYGMIGMLSIFSLIASTLQESGFVAALANREKVSDKDYNAVFPPHLPIRKISAMKTTMQSFGSVCLQVGCFTYYYFSYPHTLQSFTILRH